MFTNGFKRLHPIPRDLDGRNHGQGQMGTQEYHLKDLNLFPMETELLHKQEMKAKKEL